MELQLVYQGRLTNHYTGFLLRYASQKSVSPIALSANKKGTENDMSQQGIEITPSITVHELLEAYPELEDVLIGIAPPFKKLKNPILRRSVAKIATIKHISSVGGVPA